MNYFFSEAKKFTLPTSGVIYQRALGMTYLGVGLVGIVLRQ